MLIFIEGSGNNCLILEMKCKKCKNYTIMSSKICIGDTTCENKQTVAEYIKNNTSLSEIPHFLVDTILKYETHINSNETIDWIKWLIAGGRTLEDFTNTIKQYDNSSFCRVVWEETKFAYRCNTCSLASCMALCYKCFSNGHHEGHDFSLFCSNTGGRCDCGDPLFIKPEGFCKNHNSGNISKTVSPPPDLMHMPKFMIPHVFYRLILHCRHSCLIYNDNSIIRSKFDLNNYCTMLYNFTEMGTAMTTVLISVLISEDDYRKFTPTVLQDDDSTDESYTKTGELSYGKALTTFIKTQPPCIFNVPFLTNELKHSTFLQELIFWAILYEFPQKLVKFLLALLPDQEYRLALAEAIIINHECLLNITEKCLDTSGFIKRVSNLCVQVFSSEHVAFSLVTNCNLLEVLIFHLGIMVYKNLEAPVDLTISPELQHYIINCESTFLNMSQYWNIVCNLDIIFSHNSVALKFLNNDNLHESWISIISHFQGMNVNTRFTESTEREREYKMEFTAEVTCVLKPATSLIAHLKNDSTAALTKKLMKCCLSFLNNWVESPVMDEIFSIYAFSFHIPLHRVLAKLLKQAVNVQHIDIGEILPGEDFTYSLLVNPLEIQVCFYEIINDLWKSTDIQMQIRSSFYTEKISRFCFREIDLYLLQVLCTRISNVTFIHMVMEKFGISESFMDITFLKDEEPEDTYKETVLMLDCFLEFLAILCGHTRNLDDNFDKSEIVSLLSIADRSHSDILKLFSTFCKNENVGNFDSVLLEVADYKPPSCKSDGNLLEGKYVLKEPMWEELFDPINVIYRSGPFREWYQCAMERYSSYVRRNKGLPSGTFLWPPFRIPKLCNSSYTDPRYVLDNKLFHAVIWMVLYKFYYESAITEHVLSLAVYLFEMLLTITPEEVVNKPQERKFVDVINLNLISWFPSNHLLRNVTTIIRNITVSSSDLKSVEVNESIISLLLNIYLKYNPNICIDLDDTSKLNQRIGSAKDFIEKILVRLVSLSQRCREEISAFQVKIQLETVAVDNSKNENDECEKKRKAEERRRQILESFALQRKNFAEKNKEILELDEKDKLEDEQESEVSVKKYLCGICKEELPSTCDNPIVLSVYAQASNLLNIKDESTSTNEKIDAFEKLIELDEFEKSSVEDLSNSNLTNDVIVQTCGHFFDKKCFKMLSRHRTYFPCPVCRQVANCFLVILPEVIEKSSLCVPDDVIQSELNINEFLKMQVEIDYKLCGVLEQSLQSMEHCLHMNLVSEVLPNVSLPFYSAFLRTNVEYEMVLRDGTLLPKTDLSLDRNVKSIALKKSCIKYLVQVLICNVKMSDRQCISRRWIQLTDIVKVPSDKRNYSPLLMRDPITLFLQFILSLPLDLHQSYFILIVQIIYNLLYFRITTYLSVDLNKAQRNYFRNLNLSENKCGFSAAMKFTIESLDKIHWFVSHEQNSGLLEENLEKELEQKMRKMSLRFLHVASLLNYHMYNEELPEILNAENEFDSLMSYLKIVPCIDCMTEQNSTTDNKKLNIVECWFEELNEFTQIQQKFLKKAISKFNFTLMQPKLIELPQLYINLISMCANKHCKFSQNKCAGNAICLMCGAVICFEMDCCKRENIFEGIHHAVLCGGNTAIYLHIPSTNVVIICGQKMRWWGSVYLDIYGEEDPSLRRGKPLYLCTERYKLLETQWLCHNFIQTKDNWRFHNNRI